MGNVSSGPNIIDAEKQMSRVQGERPRNSDLDHPRITVACKQFLSVRPEERGSHVLIELSPIRQVVIEALGQTSPRERGVDLVLPMASDLANGRVELLCHFMPSGMRCQC